jgi:hypothetical protein
MKKGTFFVPFVASFFRCKCKVIGLYNPKINGGKAKSLKFDKTVPKMTPDISQLYLCVL